MLHDFWKGKKVFVLGHTGFKGGWFSLILHTLGAKLAGYSLYPNDSQNVFYMATRLKKIFEYECFSIFENRKRLRWHTSNLNQICFHFAAQPLVKIGYTDPLDTFDTNIMGLVALLESRNGSISPTVIIVTSDKCYDVTRGKKLLKKVIRWVV